MCHKNHCLNTYTFKIGSLAICESHTPAGNGRAGRLGPALGRGGRLGPPPPPLLPPPLLPLLGPAPGATIRAVERAGREGPAPPAGRAAGGGAAAAASAAAPPLLPRSEGASAAAPSFLATTRLTRKRKNLWYAHKPY